MPTAPEEPILDQAALEELYTSLGGREGLPVVARLYQRTARRSLAELEQALEAQDAPEAQRMAHNIKSSSRYVGATQVAQVCAAAEAAAGAGDLDAVRAQLSALHAAIARASAALDEEVDQ